MWFTKPENNCGGCDYIHIFSPILSTDRWLQLLWWGGDGMEEDGENGFFFLLVLACLDWQKQKESLSLQGTGGHRHTRYRADQLPAVRSQCATMVQVSRLSAHATESELHLLLIIGQRHLFHPPTGFICPGYIMELFFLLFFFFCPAIFSHITFLWV